jgi:hypothetical protein
VNLDRFVEGENASDDRLIGYGSSGWQSGSNAAERVADVAAKELDGNDTNNGNQTEKQTVFDQRGSSFFSAKMFDQLEHAKEPFENPNLGKDRIVGRRDAASNDAPSRIS